MAYVLHSVLSRPSGARDSGRCASKARGYMLKAKLRQEFKGCQGWGIPSVDGCSEHNTGPGSRRVNTDTRPLIHINHLHQLLLSSLGRMVSCKCGTTYNRVQPPSCEVLCKPKMVFLSRKDKATKSPYHSKVKSKFLHQAQWPNMFWDLKVQVLRRGRLTLLLLLTSLVVIC